MTATPDQSESETRRQLDALSCLADVTCQLAGLHVTDLILNCVTNGVCDALCSERASLYLISPDDAVLHTRVVTELEIEEIRAPIDSGIIGWVARTRQLANVPRPATDSRWNSAIDHSTGFHTRNILAAPVISVSDQKLLGVLQILNRDNGDFDEFDEQLILAFAAHAATALERATLLDQLRKAQELKVSVELARRIQTGFLPSSLRGMEGYERADWWEPAESVSGDYYDILQLPDGRIALIVADVTGHGVGPSLIMASVRAMLHVLARTYSDPIQIVTRLEEAVEPDLNNGWFVTLFLGALDLKDHELEYVNAGHGPVIHTSAEQSHLLAATGLPLGVSRDQLIHSEACDLKTGDLLLLATDGSIETCNADRELFGSARLIDLLSSNQNCPVDVIIHRIREAIRAFHGKPHPADDITMLLVKRVTNELESPASQEKLN